MQYENIEAVVESGVARVTVNRPDKLNALNVKTVEELHDAFLSLRINRDAKVILITGSGDKAFIAGADIGELAKLDGASGREYVLKGQEMTKQIESSPKPVIAAINGFALGGGTEVALACHVRIASDNAMLGQPEVKLGLIPGFGGTQRLARLVGKGHAMELILSGRMISAKEALQIGLVNRVVDRESLLETCHKLAHDIISNGPKAVEFAIQAIHLGLDRTLDEGLLLEADLFGKACLTEDSKEGTSAFLEKRPPSFKGN